MKRILCAACACLWGLQAFAAPPSAKDPASDLFKERPEVSGEKITIDQAISIALKDSYQIIDAIKSMQIYEQQLKEANSYFYPTISIDGSYSRALKKGRMPIGETLMEIGQNNTFTASAGLNYLSSATTLFMPLR